MSGGVTAMMLNGGRCPSHQMCVESCPTDFWLYQVHGLMDLADQNIDNFYCTPQAQATLVQALGDIVAQLADGKTFEAIMVDVGETIETLMSQGLCSPKQLPSVPFQNRCLPGSPDNADVKKGE